MALFEILISESAEDDFLQVPFPFRRQINQRIQKLKADPFPRGREAGELGFFALEVFGWRILYGVDEPAGRVIIYRISRG